MRPKSSASTETGGIERLKASPEAERSLFVPQAVAFLAELHRRFDARRRELLARRLSVQAQLDQGQALHFLEETAAIREGNWRVAPIVPALSDRRVEITGPVDQKMIINALNSGANVFMADFEDSNSPTYENCYQGQLNLMAAVRGTLTFDAPQTGKHYEIGPKPATLIVRPRGWHLEEKHLQVDGQFVSGSLFDFGLFFFHNAQEQLARGAGPYFYLPKMESHLEARLWNDVFLFAQEALGLARGTIRATVLIETLPAAFEMDEILYELREHSSGLNCGRWDYIFSFIKKRQADPHALLPDRAQVTMDRGFLRAYSQLLIKTCHRRGAHAMGGMAAQIPIKDDDAANRLALQKVHDDKLREVKDGHDGTWVAHPALVQVARDVFDLYLKTPNQVDRQRPDVVPEERALLAVPKGTRTLAGLRSNIQIGIQYLAAWLGGSGCVPLNNLMEDAATAEISRAQVWQWQHHHAKLDDGTEVTPQLVTRLTEELMAGFSSSPEGGRYRQAQALFMKLALAPRFTDFLTLPAYEQLLADHSPRS